MKLLIIESKFDMFMMCFLVFFNVGVSASASKKCFKWLILKCNLCFCVVCFNGVVMILVLYINVLSVKFE